MKPPKALHVACIILASFAILALSAGAYGATATANDDGAYSTFGAPNTFSVAGGLSYSGIVSQVTGESGTGAGSLSFANPAYPNYSPMQAQILAGTASANAPAISLGWRTRLVSETAGTSSTPPIQNSAPTAGLVSDVLNLTGIAPSGTGSGVGTHQTDVFVLQMSYSPTEAVQMYNVGDTAGWTEMDIVRNWHPGIDGGIQLGYLDQGTGTWEFAVQGNLPNTYPISTIYYWEKRDGSEQGQGSWSNFVADYGVTDANLGNFLGDMGVDVTTHTVWAVVDHNSQFAVIPEPATLCVLAIGGILTLARRRRA